MDGSESLLGGPKYRVRKGGQKMAVRSMDDAGEDAMSQFGYMSISACKEGNAAQG